jgi:ribosomal protein S18 acetylase RimI-like enzyme
VNVEIRDASTADIEPIVDLMRACIAGMRSRGIDQWDEVYPDRRTIEGDVQNNGAAVVAIADQAIVGFAVLDEHQEPEYGAVAWRLTGRAAVVHRMMVAPPIEGCGIARALMTFLESRATSSGYSSIRLDAFVNNPRAVRFYERCGYRRAGQVRFRKGDFYCFEKELGSGDLFFGPR